MNLLSWGAVILCAVAGWLRWHWLWHLGAGFAAGAIGGMMGRSLWAQVGGDALADTLAFRYLVSALLLCAAVYWGARGLKSFIDRRRAT